MNTFKRWVVLEHVGAPDDPAGRHFDLLLEDCLDCRAWRLEKLPQIDGPEFQVAPLVAHKLEWLETKGALVSGGRGWAEPICSGFFTGHLPPSQDDYICIELTGYALQGILEIDHSRCKLSSIAKKDS